MSETLVRLKYFVVVCLISSLISSYYLVDYCCPSVCINHCTDWTHGMLLMGNHIQSQ